MDMTLQIVVGAVIGYLLGMIPTGGIVGRCLGVDLTQVGSRRTGATNALRTLGLRWAILVGVGDFLKGTVAVLLTGWIVGGAPWEPATWGQVVSACFAVLGHTFSPLLGFRGGRGIITGGGALIVLSPLAFLVSFICGVITVTLTRYMSLGSLVGTVVAGTVVVLQTLLGNGPTAFLLYGTALPAFIIVAHRDNIQRLLGGTERKLSRGSRTQTPNASGEQGGQRTS